jgi:uncharacterized protein (TIGR00297 family)
MPDEPAKQQAPPRTPELHDYWWLYLLAIGNCFFLFPRFAAAGAAAVAIAGAVAGRAATIRAPKPKLPWNEDRSWVGLAAFLCAALAASIVALYLLPCPWFLKSDKTPEWPFVWTLSVLAATTGAALWSLHGPLTPGLRVPLSLSALLWLAAGFLSFATRRLPANTPVQPEIFLHALAINGALAAALFLLRFASLPAVILGASFGVIVYFFAQWQGYLLFVLFVGTGSALSRLGLARKNELGVAEPRKGRRGIANAAANLLVPTACCLAYPASGGNPAFLIAYAGAIAAALADTASAEIGVLAKTQPVLITSRQAVAHGTNGAVSRLGMAAALVFCLVVAGVAWASGFLALVSSATGQASSGTMAIAGACIVAGGMAGTTVDSLLGATIEDRWFGVGKGVVNFACTLAGAAVAGGLWAACLSPK